MTSRRVSRRGLCAGIAALVVAFAATDGLLISAFAQGDDALAASYGIYNGQVAATADREQVGSTVDAGFTAGEVDNFYPLARVEVATAGTNATATPADTGPFAQAVFAGQNVQQPQYVNAQYPGTQNPPPYSAGSATAAASVTPASATASGTYGATGGTGTPGSPPPDGSDGGTASDSTYFDAARGFVSAGDSRVQHASYGAGVLVIDNVHVAVQVSSNGSAFAKTISITVGGAAVTVTTPAPLGQAVSVPVTIDQNGVTARQPLVPGGPLQAATQAANAALAAAGLSVHTVAPEVTQDGADLHVDAVGVVVDQEHVGGANGVPSQFVVHTLGEVVLDNEATLAPPQLDNANLGAANPAVPASSTSVIGGSSGTAPSGASKAPTRAGLVPVSAVVTQPRPRWLLLAYFAWQALMLALAGALYLRRAAARSIA